MAPFDKNSPRFRAYLLVLMNVSFAAVAILAQVGQNVSLPIWVDATQAMNNPNCTTKNASSYYDDRESEDFYYYIERNSSKGSSNSTTSMDPFFVLSFASLSFVVIFGVTTGVIALVQVVTNLVTGEKRLQLITVKDDLLFPQWQLILIGVFDALNGVFVVFASSSSRTAPFLQAILGNFIIPLTILLRLLLLRKRPTLLKFLSACAVLLGLLLSLVPVISGMDKDSKKDGEDYYKQSRLGQILWPLVFMFGFVPAAVMNVIEEKSLKDRRRVNLFYLLFCTSFYQLLTVWLLFWADIVPQYGYTHSIQEFGANYKFAMQCFFGGAGCNYQPGLIGTIFIVMYVASYIGGGLLLRYSEGATYLAIVQSLVTPLGALFWSIFNHNSCASIWLDPHAGSLTYFSIGGMVIMVPAIFFYNIGTFEELKRVITCDRGSKEVWTATEKSPLLQKPAAINYPN